MSKYIDAERLKAEIRRQKHELELSIQSQGDYGQSCHIVAYENIISLIDSLQQEQPSLPDNLDDAAKKYGHEEPILPEGYNDGDIPLYERWTADAFKAGAEWMAKQGFISEGIINQTSGEDTMIDLNEYIGYLEDCEEVIVNIRKKEEKK